MKKISITFLAALCCAGLMAMEPKTSVKAPKKINVVTTLSVLKALTNEVGGDLVAVTALSSSSDDPHFVKPKPTFKEAVMKADLFIQIGRSLELWVPEVLGTSSAKLVTASAGIKALEVPKELTRAHGDIHPEGNPHVWLSPLNALKMAENIKNELIAKAPDHKDSFEKNFTAFKKKIAEALFGKELLKAGTPDFLLRLHDGKNLDKYVKARKKSVEGWVKLAQQIDYTFITYHSVWTYLADEFGLKVFDAKIEEKSGIEPTLTYQNDLIKRAKAAGIKHIVAASYYVGNTRSIDHIVQGIGGRKIFIDVDCRQNEDYVAMIGRVLKGLADFKNPVINAPKKLIK